MYEAINTLLLVIQFILLLRAVSRISTRILDFGAIFIVLYVIWYVPIIYDMLYEGHLFDSEYNNLMRYYSRYFIYDDLSLTKFNIITTFIMLFFEIGYSSRKFNLGFSFETSHIIQRKKYRIAQWVLFSIWLLLEIRGFFSYGGSIAGFFASTKKDMYGSVISQILVLKLPILMLANFLYYKISKESSKTGIPYILIIMIASLQTSQRREIISNFIFVVVLFVSYYATKRGISGYKPIRIRRSVKRYIAILFAAAICMVPLLWYLRVFSNRMINYGATNVVFSRSFFELLLSGSGVSGFPTLIIFDQFGKQHGMSFYFRELLFTLQSFIPRNLFPGKMKALNILLRDMLGIPNNLSMFYINELYYTFGLLSIPISTIVGYILSRLYGTFANGNLYRDKVFMALFISNIIKLFKNGLSSFVTSVIFISIILIINFTYLGINHESDQQVS